MYAECLNFLSYKLFAFLQYCSCGGHLLGRSFVSSGSGRRLLQREDHSGSRPQSFPGYCHMRSGTPPERFPTGPELAGS